MVQKVGMFSRQRCKTICRHIGAILGTRWISRHLPLVPTRILAQVTQNHTLELSFLAHFPKTAGVFLALILTLELFFFGVRV